MRAKYFSQSLLVLLLVMVSFSLPAAPAGSQIQFDVFPGYDRIVPEASWFPMVFEVKNDGPSFVGTVKVTGGKFNAGQVRLTQVELPTGTKKRFVIPFFSNTRAYSSWDVRLFDEKGKVRAEQLDVTPRKQVAAGTTVLGAMARTAGGVPSFFPTRVQSSEMQPIAAHLLPPIFPDNPLVLEGMSTIYLNSEKVSDLSVNQAGALRSWLLAGGHLVVAMEQVSDLAGSSWLQDLMPIDPQMVRPAAEHGALNEWLQQSDWRVLRARRPGQPATSFDESGVSPFLSLAPDPAFEAAPIQAIFGKVRDGRIVAASGETPLMVTAERGNGRITALMFSPEREPLRSWKHLPIFWAKLADVPGTLYSSSDVNQQGGWSTDGIVGAMIDSRQVQKLPISWLFLLLMVYLAVIGPLDHYWLKKINRPMLTWVTFPCYVVAFSLLIYLIGYKLRAGESEWNELHIVDLLRHEGRTELRGRSYSSAYSPSNLRFQGASQQRFASLRTEFSGTWGSGDTTEKGTVVQTGDTFKADLFVPVWTSQLFVQDWANPGGYAPVVVDATREGNNWTITINNRTDKTLTHLQFVSDGRIQSLGEVPAKQTRTFTAVNGQGTGLREFVWQQGHQFSSAASGRQRAFGGTSSGRLNDLPAASTTLSFVSKISEQQENNQFVAPPGLDLTGQAERGKAVLLAWSDSYAPVQPLTLFKPKRSHRQTLWRVTIPQGQ